MSFRPFRGPSISASQAARDGWLSMPVSISARPVAVLDEVEVDVIEPERQREPRPENPRPNFDDSPGFGRLGKGEDERLRQAYGSSSGLSERSGERLKARRFGRVEPPAGVRTVEPARGVMRMRRRLGEVSTGAKQTSVPSSSARHSALGRLANSSRKRSFSAGHCAMSYCAFGSTSARPSFSRSSA